MQRHKAKSNPLDLQARASAEDGGTDFRGCATVVLLPLIGKQVLLVVGRIPSVTLVANVWTCQ